MSENGPNTTVFRVPVIGPQVPSLPLLSFTRPALVRTGLCDCPAHITAHSTACSSQALPSASTSRLLSVEVLLILQVLLNATSPTRAVLTSQKLIPSLFSFLLSELLYCLVHPRVM